MTELIRAAQYLRMSTEHQNYSLAYQAAANQAYAVAKGYEIVATFEDAGISGLELQSREALKQLLATVVLESAPFDVIIVYDVSRWGRFQDPDESAHYEFICRSSGVPVEYSAESFANDGSMAATLLKSLKRIMAAEYSRELASKIARGKRGLSRQGFWTGGPPGFGFRRLMVTPGGTASRTMEDGQRKDLQGYRTLLTKGPPDEVALVRKIFKAYDAGKSRAEIVRHLNHDDPARARGTTWTQTRLNRLLSDEKCIGVLVSGRVHYQLGKCTRYASDGWVRVQGGCPALVSKDLFDRVAERLARSKREPTDEEMLDHLRGLLKTHGKLSYSVMRGAPPRYGVYCYHRRFGSVYRAFELAGYDPPAWRNRSRENFDRLKPYLHRTFGPQQTDEELLAWLAELYEKHGRLSADLIQATRGGGTASTFARRFGSLYIAYARVGYTPPQRPSKWNTHPQITRDLRRSQVKPAPTA